MSIVYNLVVSTIMLQATHTNDAVDFEFSKSVWACCKASYHRTKIALRIFLFNIKKAILFGMLSIAVFMSENRKFQGFNDGFPSKRTVE